jgi:hypothetical protein
MEAFNELERSVNPQKITCVEDGLFELPDVDLTYLGFIVERDFRKKSGYSRGIGVKSRAVYFAQAFFFTPDYERVVKAEG